MTTFETVLGFSPVAGPVHTLLPAIARVGARGFELVELLRGEDAVPLADVRDLAAHLRDLEDVTPEGETPPPVTVRFRFDGRVDPDAPLEDAAPGELAWTVWADDESLGIAAHLRLEPAGLAARYDEPWRDFFEDLARRAADALGASVCVERSAADPRAVLAEDVVLAGLKDGTLFARRGLVLIDERIANTVTLIRWAEEHGDVLSYRTLGGYHALAPDGRLGEPLARRASEVDDE